MKFVILRNLIILCSLVLMTGCASITRGTDDKLEITTEPPGATVELTRTKGRFTDKQLIKAIGEKTASELLNGEKTYEGSISKTTPTTFIVPRKGEYKLVVTKEGYQSHEVIIGNKVVGKGATGMAGNLLLGGVIGLGVDAATGAAKDLTPNPVHVLLGIEGGESKLVIDEELSEYNSESIDQDAAAIESNEITTQKELTLQSDNSDTAVQE